MALIIPPGVESDGADLVAWVPTLANPSEPTVAELSAASAVLIACYLTGAFEPTADTETNEDKRYCSSDTSETPGKTKFSISDIEYIADPQNAGSNSAKAAEALVDGLSGHFVRRMGKDVTANPAFAAGDVVEAYTATLGPQIVMPGESGQKVRIRQKVMNVRRTAYNHTIAA